MSTQYENEEKPRGLGIEKLRTYKGFENITDEEASKVIETILEFVEIVVKNPSISRYYEED